jgi:hypothetical protein
MGSVNRTLSESKRELIRRLREDWLPAYCNDPKRNYSMEGFCIDDGVLTDQDAHDFLRALDSGVVMFADRQRLKMAHGLASETLFWEGERKITPRPISLWLETVITVAAAGRLHLDYGWPAECLGMQSKGGAFDLMAFKPPDFVNEYVAVEVKKTSRELDRLLANLTKCGEGEHDASCDKGTRMNAHRKWIALRARRAKLFWTVGPNADSRLFEVIVDKDTMGLESVPEGRLQF